MKRILVVSAAGLDEAWVAEPAAQLAQETGAAVTVLVVDDVESQRFTTLPRDELLRQAGVSADRIVERLAEAGVEATPVARAGPAALHYPVHRAEAVEHRRGGSQYRLRERPSGGSKRGA